MSLPREFETKLEHAVMMAGGGYHVHSDDPEIEGGYPLAEWITDRAEFGGKVYQRTIIVLTDWQEVSPCSDRWRD